MKYTPVPLKDDIKIDKLVTVHYFEFTKDYTFNGEQHNFWELVYVDKGQLIAYAEDNAVTLKQGQVIFHKPNEWHNIKADGAVAANAVILSFVCQSAAMKNLNGLIYDINYYQKELLTKIIMESEDVFSSPLNDPYTTEMVKNKHRSFGSEQLIKLYLAELLISVLRTSKQNKKTLSLSMIRNKTNNDIADAIIEYLTDNLGNKITFNDVANHVHLSKTTVKNVFSQVTGMGVMKYYNKLKIEKAKIYIREENYNISQIANLLGYDSIHYFSRQFKNQVNLSPTQYAKSVKSVTSGRQI